MNFRQFLKENATTDKIDDLLYEAGFPQIENQYNSFEALTRITIPKKVVDSLPNLQEYEPDDIFKEKGVVNKKPFTLQMELKKEFMRLPDNYFILRFWDSNTKYLCSKYKTPKIYSIVLIK